MARMASQPRIGALIRDAMKQKSLRQWQLAEDLGVSRSAVNAWVNDRAYPQSYVIVPLERRLGIKLPAAVNGQLPAPAAAQVPADPRERSVWDLAVADGADDAEAQEWVEQYRQWRSRRRASA